MKRIICTFLIFLPFSLSFAQTADSTKSDQLDDVVVQENFEDEFFEDKFPVQFNLDLSNVVKIDERVNWKSIDVLYEKEVQGGADVMPLHFSKPQFTSLQPAPVKQFFVKLQSVKQWELNIMTSEGTIFRRITGNGNPPSIITWDGLSDAGEPLIPGFSYSYSLNAVDKAGNKRLFTGKTFSVPSFYLKQNNTVVVGISGQMLFADVGYGLNPDAKNLAAEVAGIIRFSSNKNRISFSCSNSNIDKFISLVAKELVIENSSFWHIKRDDLPGDNLYLYIE